GKDMADVIADTNGGGVFSKDSEAFIYTRVDDNHRPSKLCLHRIGETGADRLIHEETDPGFFLGAGKTQSGDWIVVDSHDHESSQSWLLPADDPDADLIEVSARETGVEYD
ncbi:MAG: S9 family peptidase, partial [Nitratireductor sp.]|nr:S9 family peptidase [Nitratireductor sp.]